MIEILFCGVCHSDLHATKNEWHNTVYPIVPGHEIVGKITSVGDHVTKFKVGDLAAMGCMVNSCRECDYCHAMKFRLASTDCWVLLAESSLMT